MLAKLSLCEAPKLEIFETGAKGISLALYTFVAMNESFPVISILGAGWLGLPFGAEMAEKGYRIKGSTTRTSKLAALRKAGIQAYHITLQPAPAGNWAEFMQSDILVLNLPPSQGRVPGRHEKQLEYIKWGIRTHGIKKVLFVSATSVYPNLCREVSEADARYVLSPHSGQILRKLEELFTRETEFQTTVLRFGGLFGPGREPGNFLSGKKKIPGASTPVNVIHLDDCIGIMEAIIKQEKWGEIYNAVAPEHPSKREFYQKASKLMDKDMPDFTGEGDPPFKIVSSEKLIRDLGYAFKYANPMDGLPEVPKEEES